MAVVIEEQQSGTGSGTSVTTSTTLSVDSEHKYFAFIGSKIARAVTSVTGMGLTWTLVEAQCSGRSQTEISVWEGTGTTSSGTITANFTASTESAVIVAYRMSGVNTTTPVLVSEGANTNGEDDPASCTGGTDDKVPSLSLDVQEIGSLILGCFNVRSSSFTPGTGYVLETDVQADTGGDASTVTIESKTSTATGATTVDASLGSDTDWSMVAVEFGAVGAVDHTFDVDGRIAVRELFTVDARLAVRELFTIDARLSQLAEFTVDAKLSALAEFTIDSRLAVRETFTVDSRLSQIELFTIDARLSALEEFTIDSRLSALAEFDVDAFIELEQIFNFKVDGLIQGEITKFFLVDAFIQNEFVEDFFIDGRIAKRELFTVDARLAVRELFTVDAELRPIQEFTVDSRLSALAEFTVDGRVAQRELFTVDARLSALAEFTVDARLSALAEFTVDAELRPIQEFTVDAELRPIQEFTVDSFIQALNQEETFLVDARLKALTSVLVIVDSFVQKLNQEETFFIDALIQTENIDETFLVDAVLEGAKIETFLVDAFTQTVFDEDFFIDSLIRVLDQEETFIVDAQLANIIAETFLVDAVIQAVFDEDFLVDSQLAQRVDEDFTINALIAFKKEFTIDATLSPRETFTVDGKLKFTVDETFLIDGITLDAGQKIFLVNALVQKTFDEEFTIDGSLGSFNEKTFTVDAFTKAFDTEKTFTIDARTQDLNSEIFDVDAVILRTGDVLCAGGAGLAFFDDFTTSTGWSNDGGSQIQIDSGSFPNVMRLVNLNSTTFGVKRAHKTFDDPVGASGNITWEFKHEHLAGGSAFASEFKAELKETTNASLTGSSADEITIRYRTDVVSSSGPEDLRLEVFDKNGINSVFSPQSAITLQDNFVYYPRITKNGSVVKLELFTDSGRNTQETGSPVQVDTAGFDMSNNLNVIWIGNYGTGGSARTSNEELDDISVKGSLCPEFTIDSFVQILDQEKTFTVDALLGGATQKLFLVDGFVQKLNQEKTFIVDVFISDEFTKTFLIDGIIVDPFSEIFTIDSLIETSDIDKTFTVGAVLKVEQIRPFQIDAKVIGAQTKTFIVDAQIFLPTLANFTVDGLLLETKTLDFTVDAKVLDTFTKDFLVDGITFVFPSQLVTIDGLTLGEQDKDFTVNAIIRFVNQETFDIDVLLKKEIDKVVLVDAIINDLSVTFGFTTDALLVRIDLFTVDAVILLTGDVRCAGGDTTVFQDDFTTNTGWTNNGGLRIQIDTGAFPDQFRFNNLLSRTFLGTVRATKNFSSPLKASENFVWQFTHVNFNGGGFASEFTFDLKEDQTDVPNASADQTTIRYRTDVVVSNGPEFLRLEAFGKDGATFASSSPANALPLTNDITYYPRITKTGNFIKLELFTDSGRTIQEVGSPLQIDVSTLDLSQDLNAVWLGNYSTGGSARQIEEKLDDMLVTQSLCPQFTIDALLDGETIVNFTIDAVLAKLGVFTVDAFLISVNIKTFDIDSFVQELDQEELFTVDAKVIRAIQVDVDGFLTLQTEVPFTVDSRLSRLEEFNIDGKLISIFDAEFLVDGSTLGTVDKDFTIDGITIIFPSGLILIDAIIQAQATNKVFTVDSIVEAFDTEKDFTVDSQLVQDEIPKQFTIDGRVALIQTTDFEVDSIIKQLGANGNCNFIPESNFIVDTGLEQFIGPIQPIHENNVEQLVGQEVTLNNQQVRSVSFLLRSSNFPNEITTNMPIDAQVWSGVVVGNGGGETIEAVSTTVINASNTSGDLPPGDWTLVKFEFDVNTTPFLTGDFVVGYRSLSTVNDPAGVGTAIPIISNSNVILGSAVFRRGANSTLGEFNNWLFLTEGSKDMVIQLEVEDGDNVILGVGNQCPLVDAILDTPPNKFEVDSIVTDRFQKDFTVDAVLFAFLKPFIIDGILIGTELPLTVDAVIVPELKTFTMDGIILQIPGIVFSIDATLQPFTRFEVDGLVQAIDKNAPLFNCNALLSVERTEDFIIDGLTKFFNKVEPFRIDAQVIVFPSLLPQVDAMIKEVGAPRFFFVNALVQRLDNLLFPFTNVDALIVKENIGKPFLVDGLIKGEDVNEDFIVDAKLSTPAEPILFSVDAITNLQNGRWQTDALLSKSKNLLFLVDVFLAEKPQKSFLVDGITIGDVDEEFIIDGLLQVEDKEETFLVDGRISESGATGDFTINAILRAVLTQEFTIDTLLVRVEGFSINGVIQALGDGETFTGNNGGTNPNNSSDPFEDQTTDDNTVTLPIGTLVGQRLRLSTAPVRVTSYTFVIHRAGTAGTPTGTLTGKIYKNSISGNSISGADLIATSDNVVNLSSITTSSSGSNVQFTFTAPPEITVDDNVFIGFDIAGSNEQMFLHTESTGTVIDGGDVNIESTGVWGADLGVDAVLTILIDTEARQRASALISSFVGRFIHEFEVNSLVKSIGGESGSAVPAEFTISANIRFKRIEEFKVGAILIGSQDFTVGAFVGETLFTGLTVESVIVENNSDEGVESVIVENNSDSGVESVIGQDT